MLKLYKEKCISFLTKGHVRTIQVKKNVLSSFIIKGMNILLNLFLVPLTLDFISPIEYGIWLTISSIIGWFSFFDIGFGNGLRNKFTEAVSLGKYKLARIYISTTYAILIILIITFIFIFLIIEPLIDWSTILNCNQISEERLSKLVKITFLFFCFQFILQLISTILTANHEPSKSNIISLISNILIFLFIFIISKTTHGDLMQLAFILGFCPVIILIIVSLYLFNTSYKRYSPSFKLVRFKYSRNLMNIGVKFFIIQIAFVVLYQTNNLIIIQKFGPEDVTPFNISYKYFFILPMFFNILSLPLWSAYTDAWIKKDIHWIKNTIKKMHKLFIVILISTTIMILSSNAIYSIWLGDSIKVPLSLSFYMGVYVVFNIWNGIYSQFLNGIGKVKLQLIISIFGSIINIPLAIYFCNQFGLFGTVLSTIAISLFGAIIFPIQFNKLILNKANGIWNK